VWRGWPGAYAALAREMSFPISDVDEAAAAVVAVIAAIDAAAPVT